MQMSKTKKNKLLVEFNSAFSVELTDYARHNFFERIKYLDYKKMKAALDKTFDSWLERRNDDPKTPRPDIETVMRNYDFAGDVAGELKDFVDELYSEKKILHIQSKNYPGMKFHTNAAYGGRIWKNESWEYSDKIWISWPASEEHPGGFVRRHSWSDFCREFTWWFSVRDFGGQPLQPGVWKAMFNRARFVARLRKKEPEIYNNWSEVKWEEWIKRAQAGEDIGDIGLRLVEVAK